MKKPFWTFLLVAALTVAFGAVSALALIDPRYTPVAVVGQSSAIIELKIEPAKEGKMTGEVTRVIKGKFDAKTISFLVQSKELADQAKTVANLAVAPEGTQAILFIGGFNKPEGGGPPGADAAPDAAQTEEKALLHLGGMWVSFFAGKKGEWQLEKIDEHMNPTWNGGTDMLIRAVDYIIANPDADVPAKEGVSWASHDQFAKFDSPVHAAMPVDIAGDGNLALYVECDGGDHLFKYDNKTSAMTDITAAAKLASKSKVATWLDANGNGRMDLLSWDGQSLVLYAQQPDGTFKAGEKLLSDVLKAGVNAMITIDVGKPGHPGVIISTPGACLLWNSDAPSTAKAIGAPYNGPDLGAPTACLVADFDNDGFPDIIRICEKGSLIYKGTGPGQFADPQTSDISTGPGAGSAFAGDFAGDGLLDIFTVSVNGGTKLWDNRGKMQFVDTMNFTGEISYKGSSGAICGSVGDINNDGRQDAVFFYAAGAPHLFFNRGFRSFGMANDLDLGQHNMIPNVDDGEQAGCLGDFNGDGAQDMVVIQKTGEAWLFLTDGGDAAAHCLRAVLSSKGANIGPITVTGYKGDRCLGAWNVTAGTSEAFFGLQDAGEVTLKWQFPGEKMQEKKVAIENKPIRIELNSPK